jgi:hypothetical protein
VVIGNTINFYCALIGALTCENVAVIPKPTELPIRSPRGSIVAPSSGVMVRSMRRWSSMSDGRSDSMLFLLREVFSPPLEILSWKSSEEKLIKDRFRPIIEILIEYLFEAECEQLELELEIIPELADCSIAYVVMDCGNSEREIPQREILDKHQSLDHSRRSQNGDKQGKSKKSIVILTRRVLLKALPRKAEVRQFIHLVVAVHQKQIRSRETICYRYQIRRRISQARIILPAA